MSRESLWSRVPKSVWSGAVGVALVAAALGYVRYARDHGPLHRGRRAATWVQQLGTSTATNAACQALTELGPRAVPALSKAFVRSTPPTYITLLAHYWDNLPSWARQRLPDPGLSQSQRATSDYQRWILALDLLERMGPAAQGAIPALIQVIEDALGKAKPPQLAGMAAETIVTIGVSDEQLPLLASLAQSEHVDARVTAIDILSRLRPVRDAFVIQIVRLLGDDAERVSDQARAALHKFRGETVVAIPALLRELEDPDDRHASSAAEALGLLGNSSAEVNAALNTAKQSARLTLRFEAAFALWKMGATDAASTVPALVETLQQSPSHLPKAVQYLATIGPPAKPALPVLLAKFNDPLQPATRRLAMARAICRIDSAEFETLIRGLGEIFLEKDGANQHEVLRLLSELRSNSRPAIVLLLLGMRSSNRSLATPAATLLQRADSKLFHRARSDPSSVADVLMPWLIDQLNGSPNALTGVFEAMQLYPDHIPAAVPAIIQALNRAPREAFQWAHCRAHETFAKAGARATNAVPFLIEELRSPLTAIRQTAVTALGKIGPVTKEVLAALIQALEDPDSLVRTYAARGLGNFGAAAKDAAPALERAALRAELPLYALSIVRSLKQVDPEAAGQLAVRLKLRL